MIFTDRKITIRNGKSTINEPVILYRGDYEVSIRFTIMESKFRFKSGVNLVDSEKASHGQLAILTPYGGNVFSEIVKCEDGTVTFTLTKEMIDQLEEVGLYSFQIRLFDYYRESRVSIPPVEFGIEVREPVASEDHDNEVNNAIVGYSIAKVVDGLNEGVPDTFDDNGNYNKTEWKTGDRITEGKLNKIEDALDKINQNEKNDVATLDKRITNNFNVLNSTKANQSDLLTEKTRIDNIIQLKDGSTTGDAELIDGRIGANNTVYPNIGDAIRDQIDNIVTLLPNLWRHGDFSYSYPAGTTWRYTDFDITDIIEKNVTYTLSIKSVDAWPNTKVGSVIAFASDENTRLHQFDINLSSEIKRVFTITKDAAKIVIRFQVISEPATSNSGTAKASGIYLFQGANILTKTLKDDVKINKLDTLSIQQDNMFADLRKLTPTSNNLWKYGDIAVSYTKGQTFVFGAYDVTHEVEPGKDYIISLISACDYHNEGYVIRVEATYASGEDKAILGLIFDVGDTCKFSTPNDYSSIIVRFMTVNNDPAPADGTAYYKGIRIYEKEMNTLNADIEIPHLSGLLGDQPENLWTFGDVCANYNEGTQYGYADYRITGCEPGKTYSFSINKVKNHARPGRYGRLFIDDPSGNQVNAYDIIDIEGEPLVFSTPFGNFGSVRIRIQWLYETPAPKNSTAVYADIELYEVGEGGVKLRDDVYVPMAQNAIKAVETSLNDCFDFCKNLWSRGDISTSYDVGKTWLFLDHEVISNLTPGENYTLSIGEIVNNPRIHPEYSGTDNNYVGAILQYDDSNTELSRLQMYTTTLPISFKVRDTAASVIVRLQVLSGTGAANSDTITYKDINITNAKFIDGKSLLKDTVRIQQLEELEAKIDSMLDHEDKSKWLTVERDSFTSGTIALGTNHVSINKKLIFGADINGDFGTLTLGHGKTSYGGAYMVLDNTNVTVYSYTTAASKIKTYAHGLDISGYIDIHIENNNDQNATIRIITPTGESTETAIRWSGNNGTIFVENSNCNLTNVKASWTCTDFDKEIIICSDSYGGITNSARIPYWLKTWGYNTFILDNFAGRGSSGAITSVRAILNHCSPKYIVWLMGQNDPDTTTKINSTWQAKAEELVSICKSNNIEPIFCTIPNVLGGAVDDTDIANTRHHEFKNEWVKNSGYRYIDWSAAVGADESVLWYPGMLYDDKVHPTELGARVLASRIVKDFPEITNP